MNLKDKLKQLNSKLRKQKKELKEAEYGADMAEINFRQCEDEVSITKAQIKVLKQKMKK